MIGTHLTKSQIENIKVEDVKYIPVVHLLDIINNSDLVDKDVVDAVLDRSKTLLINNCLPNDYYASYHKDFTVNDGDFIADKLSNFVNGKATSKSVEHFVDRVTILEHRYLQQEIFCLILKLIEGWSVAFDANHYDERNEFTCKMSKYLKQAIDNYNK